MVKKQEGVLSFVSLYGKCAYKQLTTTSMIRKDLVSVECVGVRGNLRERDHLQDPGVDGRIIIKMDLQEVGWGKRLHGFR